MKEFDAPKLIKLQKNNTLFLDLNGLKERKYGVSVKYYNHNENKPYKRVDYNSTVYINKHSEGWLVDIQKENLFFNRHEPDSVSETVSSLISKSIYPTQTHIDKSGIPSMGITNHNQILKRWERNKSAIKNKYSGNAIESFITSVDKKIFNKIYFEKSMQYDMFWNLLFHPKHLSYPDNLSFKTNLFLAILPYQYPIEFTGTQTLCTEITDNDSILIDFVSDEITAIDHFLPENLDSKLKYLMRLKVYFDLDFYFFFPMHTRAYFEVFSKDENGMETIIKKIQFTQYQINTDDNRIEPSKPKGMFEVTGNENKSQFKPPKKKRSFMDFIYDILGG